MDEIYYCGFNGFKQVPSQPEKHTITSLVLQTPPVLKSGRTIIDVAICWVCIVKPGCIACIVNIGDPLTRALLRMPGALVK